MKQLGKKVYASVIRTASPHPPTDESHTDEGDYAEITDDDDYVEENYAEIDVLMMTPAAEEPASGKTDGKSKNEKKAERKREKEAATKQAVRPMVRVLPQGAGGLPLTSHPVPPSSRPPVTRLLMSPTGSHCYCLDPVTALCFCLVPVTALNLLLSCLRYCLSFLLRCSCYCCLSCSLVPVPALSLVTALSLCPPCWGGRGGAEREMCALGGGEGVVVSV